jgi:HSP20 family protein
MFSLTPWRKRDGSSQLATRQFPLDRLRDEFDALFDRFFGNFPTLIDWETEWRWGLEVDDSGKEVIVRAEAPGFEADDFNVQVQGDMLTIEAEQKQQTGEKGKEGYSFAQRRLRRAVTLPPGTATDKIDARYRNGILELRMPKAPEAQPKRIEVKS